MPGTSPSGNETTHTTVCSTTAASDGTISCAGVAGATRRMVSAIGVGGSTASYVAVGSAQIATIAGGGIGDGGPATDSFVSGPEGVASDASGDIFVADDGTNLVRRIDAATGVITTVAGVSPTVGSPSYSGDGGPMTRPYGPGKSLGQQ